MEQVVVGSRSSVVGFRIAALVGGAVLVAAAAQIAVPLPGTPVPMTLQPMAVLLVGGLLGARFGAAAWADGRVFAGVSDCCLCDGLVF